MIMSAKEVLEGFDHLPADDQRLVASEIFRRFAASDAPALSDEELTACAEELFVALDQEEAESGGPSASR